MGVGQHQKGTTEDWKRCQWAEKDSLLQEYHDEEWGIQVEEDVAFFERLVLEMFQAGLSWRLVLHKRDALRRAFSGFSILKVAAFGAKDIDRLLSDKSIIRNRRKIEGAIENARIFSEIIETYGSFKNYLSQFNDSDEQALFKELKKRFRFMGPKIAESFLQSVGKISAPHEPGCWRNRV